MDIHSSFKDHLCDFCRNMLKEHDFGNEVAFEKPYTLAQLEKAAEGGCLLCSRLNDDNDWSYWRDSLRDVKENCFIRWFSVKNKKDISPSFFLRVWFFEGRMLRGSLDLKAIPATST